MFMIKLTAVTISISLFIIPAAFARSSCPDLVQQGDAAYQRHDVSKLENIYARVGQTCGEPELLAIKMRLARLWHNKAQTAVKQKDLTAAETAVNKSLSYYSLWPTVAMAGDVQFEQKNYQKASLRYQQALDIIANVNETPTPPAPEIIRMIYKNAEQSRLLAADYVKVSADRDGNPSGLALTTVRGVVFEETALPIEFADNATTFTGKGKDAVLDMLDYLSRQGSPAITLVGHTDPRGSNEHNMDLSIRRAGAVKSFLLAKGYSGSIKTLGRGESKPLQLDDPGKYTEAQTNQLNRRVELVR